jgi:hypothetical protein
MWWRDNKFVKGTSIWSVMLSVLFLIAVVSLIAMNVTDPIWRWSIAGIGTIICLLSPGGLASLFWLFHQSIGSSITPTAEEGRPRDIRLADHGKAVPSVKVCETTQLFISARTQYLYPTPRTFSRNLKTRCMEAQPRYTQPRIQY